MYREKGAGTDIDVFVPICYLVYIDLGDYESVRLMEMTTHARALIITISSIVGLVDSELVPYVYLQRKGYASNACTSENTFACQT